MDNHINLKTLKRKESKINKKGFSLIEILLAMAVFSMIIGGVVLFSVRSIEAHTKSQAMQNSIDNARFAIEGLNKKIRTSNSIIGSWSSASKAIFLVDNVDGGKYCYKFSSGKLYSGKLAESATGCPSALSGLSVLVGDSLVLVDGSFYVKDTVATSRGVVTTVVNLSYNDAATSQAEKQGDIVLQSTVSLRDYN